MVNKVNRKDYYAQKLFKNYWDKPSKNKNKLALDPFQQEKLSTLFGKEKKQYLKEISNGQD